MHIESTTPSQRLYETLREEIRSGSLSGKLPSIAQLSRRFGVCSNTVKKAIDHLKHYGLIYGQQGKGTFVRRQEPRGAIGIAITASQLMNPYFFRLFSTAQKRLEEDGYSVRTVTLAEQMLSDPLEGLLLTDLSPWREELPRLLKRFSARRIVGMYGPRIPGFTMVVNDDSFGGFAAMEYLYRMGHRHVGIIARDLNYSDSSFAFRHQGVEDFLEEHPDMKAELRTIKEDISGDLAAKDSGSVAGLLLAEHPEITAIFAFTDVLALGVLTFCQKQGIRVPEDLSLLGYDNQDFSQLLNPPLTTLQEDAAGVANAAVDLLEEPPADPGRYRKLPSLIERESVRLLNPAETGSSFRK